MSGAGRSPGLARRLVGHLARLFIGLVLLTAGFLKAVDPAEFAHQMAGYGIIGRHIASLAAPLLIALEMTLAIALLLAWRTRLAGLITAMMLVGFIAVEAYGMSIGRTESCGCFGAYVQRTPMQVMVEDLVFLAAALLAIWGRAAGRPRRRLRGSIVAAAAVLFLGFTLAAPRLPIDDAVTRLALGRTVDELGLSGVPGDLTHGRHLVVLLDIEDPAAEGIVERLNDLVAQPGAPGVVALTPAPREQVGAFFWVAGPTFDLHPVERGVLKRLYRRLPWFFLLDGGQVARIYGEAVPPTGQLLSSEAP